MEFRVLVEECSGRTDQPPPAWLHETAHLAVEGAEETLCAEPVMRFVAIVGPTHTDTEVPWCWVCRTTAGT